MLASLGSSVVLHGFGHIFMMQMFSFNFWFRFGFWSSSQTRISPEIHLFYSDWTLCPYETCMMGSLGSSVVIHWFGHIYMMQMVSFNIWFWFGFWWAFQSRIIPEIHLFYSDWTLCSMRRVWWDHWEVVLYFTDLDISLWCRWFLSISGCNSVSGAHFSPESFQRFIYFFRLDTLCLADVYVGIIGK